MSGFNRILIIKGNRFLGEIQKCSISELEPGIYMIEAYNIETNLNKDEFEDLLKNFTVMVSMGFYSIIYDSCEVNNIIESETLMNKKYASMKIISYNRAEVFSNG